MAFVAKKIKIVDKSEKCIELWAFAKIFLLFLLRLYFLWFPTMSKTGSLMRRSGVRIRSLGSSHTDLQMIIGQLKDTKAAAKSFQAAQANAFQDLSKWSLKHDNRAVQDAVCQVGEIFSVWSDVQKEFTEQIKDFRQHFQMILDGERQVDMAKAAFEAAESKELKARKELKKVAKKAGVSSAEEEEQPAEVKELTEKLALAEKEREVAQAEALDRTQEHEVVKMIRVKDGLIKFTQVGYDGDQ